MEVKIMNINKEKVSIDTRPIKCISEGNIVENKEFPAVVLVNEQQEVVSKEYYSIYELYDDHYIASAAVLTLDEESEKITAEIKAGIIRLTRDQNGKVVPFGEQTIVPFLYKDINGSNSNIKSSPLPLLIHFEAALHPTHNFHICFSHKALPLSPQPLLIELLQELHELIPIHHP